MTSAADNLALESYFDTNWSHTDVAWQNVPFNIDKRVAAGLSEWVRFTVAPGDTVQKSMGAPTNIFRSTGAIIVQIFVRRNVGLARARYLADEVAALFLANRVGSITIKNTSISTVGESGGWFQTNVNCEYSVDNLI